MMGRLVVAIMVRFMIVLILGGLMVKHSSSFSRNFFFLNLNGDGPLALIDDKLGSNFSEEVIEL